MTGAGALALVALAVFTGAFINALSGFGFALITVPLMTLAVGPKDAVVLSTIVGLVSNSTVLWRNRAAVERPVAGRLLAGSLLGMPIGVVALSRMAEQPLEVMIAVVVLASVVLLGSGVRFSHPHAATDVATGFLSGMFNTSIGIGGPPVVMLLAGRGLPKAAFRATAVTVFTLSGAVALVLFGLAGRYDRSVLVAAVVALPAMPLGFVVGDRVHHRVPEERFRALVLALLATTALMTLFNALGG
jgi:uncharacterized membrane protein YfcA